MPLDPVLCVEPSLQVNSQKQSGLLLLNERLKALGLSKLFEQDKLTSSQFEIDAASKLKGFLKQYLSDDGIPGIPHGPKALLIREILKESRSVPNATNQPDILDIELALSNKQKTNDSLGIFGEMLGLNVIQHDPKNKAVYMLTMNESPGEKCDVVLYNNGGGHFEPHIDKKNVAKVGGHNNDCGIHSLAIAARLICQPELIHNIPQREVTSIPESRIQTRNEETTERMSKKLIAPLEKDIEAIVSRQRDEALQYKKGGVNAENQNQVPRPPEETLQIEEDRKLALAIAAEEMENPTFRPR